MTERTLADLEPKHQCPTCHARMTHFVACIVFNTRITEPCGCITKLFADGPEPMSHPVPGHP